MNTRTMIIVAIVVALGIVAYLAWQTSLDETAVERVTSPAVTTESAPQSEPPAEAPTATLPAQPEGNGAQTSPGDSAGATAPATQTEGATPAPAN